MNFLGFIWRRVALCMPNHKSGKEGAITQSEEKTLVLVVGPESSGTRVLTSYLSKHPLVLGTIDAEQHRDVLDPVWALIGASGDHDVAAAFPSLENYDVVLTRRSLPHAMRVGGKAMFEEYADLATISQLGYRLGLNVICFVTVRSPVANLASWTLERASVGGQLGAAKKQYLSCYRYVFKFLAESKIPFVMVPLEALALDGENFVNGLFQILQLPTIKIKVKKRPNVNRKRYKWFTEQQGGRS